MMKDVLNKIAEMAGKSLDELEPETVLVSFRSKHDDLGHFSGQEAREIACRFEALGFKVEDRLFSGPTRYKIIHLDDCEVRLLYDGDNESYRQQLEAERQKIDEKLKQLGE